MLYLKAGYAHPQKRQKALCWIIVSLVLTLLLLTLINARLSPIVASLGREKAMQIAVCAIDEALTQTLGDAETLFSVCTDATGKATLISCDTAAANRLRSKASEAINRALNEKDATAFQIPLGNLFSAPLFSGRGPKINACILPLSVATVTLSDDFLSAGINQTLFTLSCDVTVTVRLVTPLSREKITLNLSCPVSQFLIPGNVPGVYVEK